MSETEAVILKIRKLLALSGSSNPNEAALAMAKVKQLLDKHQLAMSDAALFGTPDASTVTKDAYETPRRRSAAWMDSLAYNVSRYFGAHCYTAQGLESLRYYFVGIPDDVDACLAMYEYLVASIEVMAVQFNGGKKNAYKLGAVKGIKDQLHAMQAQTQVTSQGTALVIRKKEEIDKYYERENTKLRTKQVSKTRPDMGTFAQGYRDGKEMHIPGAARRKLLM